MKLLAPFVLLAAVLVAAVNWDQTPPPADVVFVNRGDAFTLDPQRMSYLQDFRLAYALYENLIRWNNRDLSIQPAAADLPEISADQLTYTFHISSKAMWSNGDPLTARDFIYSWQRLLFPDTAADYSNLLFVIKGAEAFFKWRTDQLAKFAALPASQRDAQQSFIEAQARFAEMVGLRALDDRTLQIALEQPCPYFLDLVCFAVCAPVHRPTVEGWPHAMTSSAAMRERGWIGVTAPPWNERRFISLNAQTGRIEQKHEWARPGLLVSNGPYVLTQWRYKRDMRLERNPKFHSPELLRNNSVEILSIEDANTAVLAYDSGSIDWLGDVGVEYEADLLAQRQRYVERYQSQVAEKISSGMTLDDALAALPQPGPGERRNIHSRPAFGTDFYSFNCRVDLPDGRANPFADARVRRAFALATDKQKIVRTATRLDEPIMNTLVPPNAIPGYDSPAGLSHDVDRARAELAAAGWKDRDGDGWIENTRREAFPTVDLLITTNSPRYKWMSLALKSQWERDLGVHVEMRSEDTKFYKEDLKQGKFMIARGRWYGDYGDPTTFLDINRTRDGNNDRGFSDAKYDAMLNAAALERDPSRRMKMLRDAEQYLLTEQMPLIPICQLVQLYMYEPGRVLGLTSHPRLIQYFWQIEARHD